MHSFTVYEFGSREFRVVLGDHVAHANADASNVRVYQGSDAQSAVLAAIAAETRPDIKAQIKRFLSPELARKVEQNTAYGPFIASDSAPRNASDAGADSAAAAVNSGGATYSYIVSVWKVREDRQKWADPIKQFHVVATLPDEAGRVCLRESGYAYAEVSLENGDFCGEVTL